MKNRKLLKSILSLAMSAVLLLPGAITYAQAEQTAEDGIAVRADANGFVIENRVLVVYTGNATKVVIPDGVTSIGSGAFLDCPN